MVSRFWERGVGTNGSLQSPLGPLFLALACMLPVECWSAPKDYNPEPALYGCWEAMEAPSAAQREAILSFQLGRGDYKNDPIGALTALWSDPELPKHLQRWAYLRQVELYRGRGEKKKAVSVGRTWLAGHPEDSLALPLRCELMKLLMDIHYASPSDENAAEVKSMFDEIQTHHSDQGWSVIEVRRRYASWLRRLSRAPYDEVVAQFEDIRAACLALIDSPPRPPEGLSLIEQARFLRDHKDDVEKARQELGGIDAAIDSVRHPRFDPRMEEETEKSRQIALEYAEKVRAERAACGNIDP